MGGNQLLWCEGAVVSGAWTLPTSPLFLCPPWLFHCTVSEFSLVYYSEDSKYRFSWVQSPVRCDIEHWGGAMETPPFSYLVRSMSDLNHMAGIWCQDTLDTSTCGIGNDSTDMVSEVNWQWGTHWVLEIGWGWCRNHIFAVRKNPRLTLPCDLRAHMRLGELSSESRTLHLETLISCLYFQPPSRIYSVSVGCDMAVSCPDPTTHTLVSQGKSSVVSSSE